MQVRYFFAASAAAISIASFGTAAQAQSTGSVEFENPIVVTGTKSDKAVGGITVPDTSKAKGVLTQEYIARQTPGNSILNTINALPGVNFQNNDPFGSAGGTLSIRGFDSSRIALTFDGIPLNDTGNYAVFSNQQIDPELIENVNVNYGSTDVDSPSAAASGSTVNYRVRKPSDDFAVQGVMSIGDYNFFRTFAVIDTGVFSSVGTKAFISASQAENNWFVNDFGKVKKKQINGRIYQPIGSNGDFISVAAHYNENRNHFAGSAPLRIDSNVYSQSTALPYSTLFPGLVVGAVRTPGTGSNNRFPLLSSEIPYHVAVCTRATPVTGTADVETNSGCGTSFDERYNPSDTGNVRFSSKFTIADGLTLTVDPSYQFVKANGGGTTQAREGLRDINPSGGTAATTVCATTPSSATNNCRVGYFGGNPFVGRDLNGDGDMLDIVNVLAASQTNTDRVGLLASIKYDVAPGHTLRLNYSFDRGVHRQTGEIGLLDANGVPLDVFPVNSGIVGGNGQLIEKRDRRSIAMLNQISGEYRGEFFDKSLIVTLGVRAPFMKRDLTNYCFTSSASGNVECFGRDAGIQSDATTQNPYTLNTTTGLPNTGSWAVPQNRVYKYDAILPNLGFVYKPGGNFSIFANYSKGLQVPGTDALYNAFFYPVGSTQANPVPETTANFDGGVRYTSRKVQAMIGPWFTRFTNRLASAFDPETQQTVYRNLGTVDKYGVDANISFTPVPNLTIQAFGSYLKSKIQNDVQIGTCPATLTAANTTVNCTVAGAPIYALTAGKRESGASVYSFGTRLQATFGPVDLAVQMKRTGERYLNDQNLPALACTATLVNAICPTVANTPTTYTGTRGIQYQVYGATAPAYTLVDIDARINLENIGAKGKSYFQLNVQNVFDKLYVGGSAGGATTQFSLPFAQIGAPRTFIGTLSIGF